MRALWNIESNQNVAAINLTLLGYWEQQFRLSNPDEEKFYRYYNLKVDAAKQLTLLSKDTRTNFNTSILESIKTEKDFQLLKNDIQRTLDNNEPQLALDRTHTLLVTYFRKLCTRHGIVYNEKETVDTIASTLNLKNRKDVVNKVEALKEELKEAKVEVEQLSAKLNAIQAASKANDIEEINGVKVLYVEEQLENAKAKQLTFDFRDQLESGIVVLVSKYEEKCSYFVSVSKDLVGQYKAGNIIKAINEVVDGRGGGKPDFAQGGCAINDNISKIKGALKNIL